jgi:hypothetical protein
MLACVAANGSLGTACALEVWCMCGWVGGWVGVGGAAAANTQYATRHRLRIGLARRRARGQRAHLGEVLAQEGQQVGGKGARQAHHALPQQRLALVHAHAQRLRQAGAGRGAWVSLLAARNKGNSSPAAYRQQANRRPLATAAATFRRRPQRPAQLAWLTGWPSWSMLRPCSYSACPVSWMAPVMPSVRSSRLKRVVMRTSVGWEPGGGARGGG